MNILTLTPGYHQYVWKLYLDKELPIAYGRELLGCDKYFSKMSIERKDDTVSFSFEDENKENILNGVVSINEGIIEYLKHVPFIMAETGIVKGTLFTINPPLYVRYSAINPP